MHVERMPQPRLRRGMTLKSKTQPHLRCGMMLYISLPLQVLFMPWVTSDKYKWVTLAERRRLGDIEVKSSTRSGSFPANVAPLDQLDESLVQSLYLAAVQFSLSSNGLRLPQHIDSIRLLFEANQEVVAALDGKLLAAGYHQALAPRYKRQFSYLLTSFYEVNGDFPRLTKGSVRAVVVDAQYRIEIDSTKFRSLPLDEILQRIG